MGILAFFERNIIHAHWLHAHTHTIANAPTTTPNILSVYEIWQTFYVIKRSIYFYREVEIINWWTFDSIKSIKISEIWWKLYIDILNMMPGLSFFSNISVYCLDINNTFDHTNSHVPLNSEYYLCVCWVLKTNPICY